MSDSVSKYFENKRNKTEEEKFTEVRIEFLLETIAKQNNHITLLKSEIVNLKKILSNYDKSI